MAKKIRKFCSEDLMPGEEVTAGALGQPLGSFKKQVTFGAVGGGLLGLAASELAAKKDRSANPDAIENSMASTIAAGASVMGVTTQRLLFFGHSTLSGRPKDLQTSFALSDIERFDAEHGKLKSQMTVTFADGSATAFEVVKGAKPTLFAEALEGAVSAHR